MYRWAHRPGQITIQMNNHVGKPTTIDYQTNKHGLTRDKRSDGHADQYRQDTNEPTIQDRQEADDQMGRQTSIDKTLMNRQTRTDKRQMIRWSDRPV